MAPNQLSSRFSPRWESRANTRYRERRLRLTSLPTPCRYLDDPATAISADESFHRRTCQTGARSPVMDPPCTTPLNSRLGTALRNSLCLQQAIGGRLATHPLSFPEDPSLFWCGASLPRTVLALLSDFSCAHSSRATHTPCHHHRGNDPRYLWAKSPNRDLSLGSKVPIHVEETRTHTPVCDNRRPRLQGRRHRQRSGPSADVRPWAPLTGPRLLDRFPSFTFSWYAQRTSAALRRRPTSGRSSRA